MNVDDQQTWDDLCAQVTDQMQARGVPGVAVGITRGGETRTAGFGTTSVEHPLPVTDDTLFQIGSITKTYTGTVLMQLVDAGEVELDATVRTYVPEFQVADARATEQATIRHLLTHVGGWAGDFFYNTGSGGDALPAYVAAMADLPQLAPVGTLYSYNNAGFSVLGAVIEAVTGQSYEAAVRERIFEPLGLEHSFFDPGEVITHRFAVGHYGGPQNPQVARPWPLPRASYPAGAIVCDIKDLLRYGAFHLGDGTVGEGTRVLETDSLQSMRAPHVTVWEESAWGLSWGVDDTHGARLVDHGGGTMGQISRLTLVPEHDFALAILTNAGAGGQLVKEMRHWILQTYLGIEIEDPQPLEDVKEADLAPFTGHYSRPFADVDLGMLGGRLVAVVTNKGSFPDQHAPTAPSPPPATVTLCGEDRLLVLDGPGQGGVVDVLRRDDGTIGWLRPGRLHVRDR